MKTELQAVSRETRVMEVSYLLLYPMPRLYHIIPKTVVQSGFDLPSLIAKLEARIGPES